MPGKQEWGKGGRHEAPKEKDKNTLLGGTTIKGAPMEAPGEAPLYRNFNFSF